MNFHLSNGIYFRRDGDRVLIVKAASFEDPGEVLVETDLNGLGSVVASASPHREQNHSFAYIYDFLKHGVMYCGGCGAKLTPDAPGAGRLSVIELHSCTKCWEEKFKPLFDWGLGLAHRREPST